MKYKGICDLGLKRQNNQDSVYMNCEGDVGIFCVADGMGGHSHGERASKEIASQIREWWEEKAASGFSGGFDLMFRSLNTALEKANLNIYNTVAGTGSLCGSTAVILFIYHDTYGMINVGDSRLYLKSGFDFRQVSTDDVWEIQQADGLTPEEIESHPYKGKLVNAVGIEPELKVTTITDTIPKRACFLLCSDGVYKMCDGKDIRKYMRKASYMDLQALLQIILQDIYNAGAVDNISAVIVKP